MADQIKGQRHDRSALVLYGTETGNSQEVAEELGRVLERLHFQTSVSEMDEVEINVLLRFTVVIFAISTTGQGEFPRNARKLWKSLLRKRLPPDCLRHVDFTTFGLGDSSYAKFNWTARKLHKRLLQLGAKEVYPRGEADDQHNEGLDGSFLPWKADLTKQLLARYPLPEGKEPIPVHEPLPPKFLLELIPTPTPPVEPSLSRQESVDFEHQLDPSRSNRHVVVAQASAPSSSLSVVDPPFTDLDTPPHDINSDRSDNSISQKDPPTPASIMDLSLESFSPDPPPFCQQVKDSHPGLETPVDINLPPPDLLPVLGTHPAQLMRNKRVTPEKHWQDVRQLTFIVDASVTWRPGDVLTIYPKNFPEDVQALIDMQQWQLVADAPLLLRRTSRDNDRGESEVVSCIPRVLLGLVEATMRDGAQVTLRHLLTHYLDITAIPQRSFLQTMSFYTDDDMHKDRLQEFCNPTFTDEFFDYTTRPRRSILEVLADFPTVQIPWNQAACHFPIMRPRQYSITTGGSQAEHRHQRNLKKVEILVAMVKYKTVLKKIRQGVCSRYLSSLKAGTQIRVMFERPSEMFYHEVAKQPERHILMVAAGTGIAPCRALIWERAENHRQNKKDVKVGGHMIIYGGRNRAADFFYEEEWDDPMLRVDVLPAFSRDQKEKIYVQDIIRKQSPVIYDFIVKLKGVIYVCGSAGAMPKAVREAFVDVLVENTGLGDGSVRDLVAIRKQAVQQIEDMVKKGHYIEEIW